MFEKLKIIHFTMCFEISLVHPIIRPEDPIRQLTYSTHRDAQTQTPQLCHRLTEHIFQ